MKDYTQSELEKMQSQAISSAIAMKQRSSGSEAERSEGEKDCGEQPSKSKSPRDKNLLLALILLLSNEGLDTELLLALLYIFHD